MSNTRVIKQDVRRQEKIRRNRVDRKRRLQRKRNICIGLLVISILGIMVKGKIESNNVRHTSTNTKEKSIHNNKDKYGLSSNRVYDEKTDEETLAKVEAPKDRSLPEILDELLILTDENEKIADIYENHEAYPEDVLGLLVNNPEAIDFVGGYLDKDRIEKIQLNATEQSEKVPLLMQWDQRWGYEEYGDSNIGLAGCGPTCLSMVISSLTGQETITPDVVAKYSEKNGHYVNGTGTSWALMTEGANHYGVVVEEVSLHIEVMKQKLDEGKLIITAMGPGDFTTGGHFIVIYGYNADGFLINDPNCKYRSSIPWDFEKLFGQIKMLWAYSAADETE